MIDTLNALMIARPILFAAKSDPDHVLYHHVQDLPNFIHIEALQILYSQLELFTNYFDSAKNFNVSICILPATSAFQPLLYFNKYFRLENTCK